MKKHNLHIAEPCHAEWNAMSGDAQGRFCSECEKNVWDLSAMTPQAAQALVAQTDEGVSLCVRYRQDAAGAIRFTSRQVPATAPVAQQRGASKLVRSAAAAASMLLALSGGASHADEPLLDPRPGPVGTDVFQGMGEFVEGEPVDVAEPCDGSGESVSDGSGADVPWPETETLRGVAPEFEPSVQGGLPIPYDMMAPHEKRTPKTQPKQVAPLAEFEAKAAAVLAQYGIILEDTEIIAQSGNIDIEDVPCIKPTPVGPGVVSPPVLMGRMPVVRQR